MDEKDFFRESFKYFKQKDGSVNFDSVIDLDTQTNTVSASLVKVNDLAVNKANFCPECTDLGLIDHQYWELYTFKNFNGFFFIKNPFTPKGQQHWIQKCLQEYTRKPSRSNLDLHHKDVANIWSFNNNENSPEKGHINKLSWVTLGYHHNWDTKVYDPCDHSDFPECLFVLSSHIAAVLNFKIFKPEAAIINYYNMKSTLGIHNDHSEEELDKPIISISFGQSAIFLIGTEERTVKPMPVFLRSGDVLLLAGQSRLAYHAVPRIIQEPVHERHSTCSDEDETWKPFHDYIQSHRINISVRQVYSQNRTINE